MTEEDFKNRFSTDIECRLYFSEVKWDGKFICKNCGSNERWENRGNYRCKGCRTIHYATAGTMLNQSNINLKKWFEIIWYIANSNWEERLTAGKIKNKFNLGSNKTAIELINKIHKAMENIENYKLSGDIIAYFGYIKWTNTIPDFKNGFRIFLALEYDGRQRIKLKNFSSLIKEDKLINDNIDPGRNLSIIKYNDNSKFYYTLMGVGILIGNKNELLSILINNLGKYLKNLSKSLIDKKGLYTEFTFRYNHKDKDNFQIFSELLSEFVKNQNLYN
jgi:hypothetical protein